VDKRFLAACVTATALTVTGLWSPAAEAAPATDAVGYQINARHDGYSAAGVARPPLTEKWRRALDYSVSYPVIANGRVFVTSAPDSAGNGTTLHALDAATGRDVWGPVDLGGGTRWSALALGAGRVYALNWDGELRAFSQRTGRLIWTTDLPDQWSFTSAPTFFNGQVFTGGAGFGGTLYAVDAATGEVNWTAQVENGDQSSPAVTATGVYVAYACEQAYRFDPETGAQVWHHNSGCAGGGGKTATVAAGGLWVRDPYDSGTPVLRLTDGTTRATFAQRGVRAPAFLGSTGFFVQNGKLRASEAATPAVAKWIFEGDGSLTTAPIVVNGFVYVGSTSGRLYAVDPATGQSVWSTDTGLEIQGPDEQNVSQPLTGLAAGQGILAVPASGTLIAYGG